MTTEDGLGSTPDGRRSIAFLCHPFHRGGVTRWMVDAAVEWARAGHQVWFVAPQPRQRPGVREVRPTLIDLLEASASTPSPRVVTAEVGNAFELGTRSYRKSVYAYLLRTGLPDGIPVIVSDDAAVWAGAAVLGKRNPVIGVLHADEEKYYALAREHEKEIAAFVGVSHRISSKLETQLQTQRGRVVTIPCGVPQVGSVPAKTLETEDVLRISWVGRIQETQKRTSDLPKIVTLVRELGCAVRLNIVGDGPDRKPLANAIAAGGLGECTTFHGWLPTPQVMRMLAASDVLLLPSNFEGMPVSVMEALMAGCAVVASRTSGIEDFADHPLSENCFWTFPIGDVRAAASQLYEAYRIPRATRRLHSRRFAVSEFSIDRCGDRYRSLVTSLGRPSGKLRYSARAILLGNAALSLPVASLRAARRAVRSAAQAHAVD